MRFKGLKFGIPKEIIPGERRIAVIPEIAKRMISEGAEVLVESEAGEGAGFSDADYVSVGVDIVKGVEDLFNQADVILKVKEPQFNTELQKHEVELMHEGQVLITFLHPAAPDNHEMIQNLADRGVIGFTLDSIPRITRAQTMDALTSMSTVAGYKSILVAADRLPKFIPMITSAVGTSPPAEAFVVGAGVAGLQAIATAKRLGAKVRAVDVRPEASEQAKTLGAEIVDSQVPDDVAVGEGGYAKQLPEDWLVKERQAIRDAVVRSDMVILTALVPGKQAPILVTSDMVEDMKPGSVIVDVSIDQGGNCELTVGGKTIEKFGVTVDGTKNLPGLVPRSSTSMFSKNIHNFVANLIEDGTVQLDKDDEIVAESIVTRDGQVVHAGAREAMGI